MGKIRFNCPLFLSKIGLTIKLYDFFNLNKVGFT